MDDTAKLSAQRGMLWAPLGTVKVEGLTLRPQALGCKENWPPHTVMGTVNWPGLWWLINCHKNRLIRVLCNHTHITDEGAVT